MNKAAVLVSVLGGLVGLVGCERNVVGETWEGQRAGLRSLQVSEDAPPAGALSGDDLPAEPPEHAFAPALPDGNDPALRGMLLAAGSRFPEPPVVHRAPPPPPPVPIPTEVVPTPEAPAPVAPPPAAPPTPANMVIERPAVRAVIPRPAPPPHPAAPPAPAPAAPAPTAP